MKFILLATLLFFQLCLYGQQSFPVSLSPRAVGLGGIQTSLQFDDRQFDFSTAALHDSIVIQGYGGNLYFIEGLSYGSLNSVIPTKLGNFHARMSQFGESDLYRSTNAHLGYSRKLAERFSASVEVNYHDITIPEVERQSAISLNIGLQTTIEENILIGFQAINVTNRAVGELGELPSYLEFGIGYIPSEKVWISINALKSLEEQIIPRLGIEYRPIDKVAFRGGYAINIKSYSFGIGLAYKKFQIDIGSAYNINLGFSTTGGVSVVF